MSDVVIRTENLGKRYRLGEHERYMALRDILARSLSAPFRWFNGRKSEIGTSQTNGFLWALRDVSFEIKAGEVVGIIGRNGAGKSTLLEILARITKPTEGYAEICGRMGSLLEVGTGFHPELTGRENVFLSGAILGMKKVEIQGKFDEIVAFAEVDKFLDTPVKHYSSGMYVRLAFAVAGHLDPEILLVDEVLAVGDAAFQKKCLGKMGDVAKQGRTVLFVSHNMGAITRLCPRSMWLDEGGILRDGRSTQVVAEYLNRQFTACAEWTRPHQDRTDNEFSFLSAVVRGRDQRPNSLFGGDEPISIEVHYEIRRPLVGCQIGTRIYSCEGFAVLYTAETDRFAVSAIQKEPGSYRTAFVIPPRLLAPGTYYLMLAAHHPNRKIYEVVEQALVFEVSSTGSLVAMDGRVGVVAPLLVWQTEKENSL